LTILSYLEWHRLASFALHFGGLRLRHLRFASPPQTAKLKGDTGHTVPFQMAQNTARMSKRCERFDKPSGRAIWILYGEKTGIHMVRFYLFSTLS